jgi:hypothetical protein
MRRSHAKSRMERPDQASSYSVPSCQSSSEDLGSERKISSAKAESVFCFPSIPNLKARLQLQLLQGGHTESDPSDDCIRFCLRLTPKSLAHSQYWLCSDIVAASARSKRVRASSQE